MSSAHELIHRLGLSPHPEGGHYRETWRHDAGPARSSSSDHPGARTA